MEFSVPESADSSSPKSSANNLNDAVLAWIADVRDQKIHLTDEVKITVIPRQIS